jgi:hypothetical protein
MYRYTVLATNPERALVALVDDLGRHHVAKAVASSAPPPGLVLVGEPPVVGLKVLTVASGEETCTLCVALLDCAPQAAVLVVTGLPAD